MSGQTKNGNPLRVGKLDTLGDIRSEAGRLYRAARRGELPASDASKLCSVLTLIARIIEGHELERRLDALEARSNGDRP